MGTVEEEEEGAPSKGEDIVMDTVISAAGYYNQPFLWNWLMIVRKGCLWTILLSIDSKLCFVNQTVSLCLVILTNGTLSFKPDNPLSQIGRGPLQKLH